MKRDFEVRADSLEKARAAFIHPLNRNADLEGFYQALVDVAEGKSSGNRFVSDTNQVILEEMRSVFDLIKSARKFDETYLGHMLSESSIPGLIGYITALRIGSNTVAREVSELESNLEPQIIDWFSDIIGYDKAKSSGTVTSGGTLANTTALWVARESFVKKEPEFQGRLLVLGNPFAHYSIKKSLWMLGGREGIAFESLPTVNMKIDPNALESRLQEIQRHNESAAPQDQIGVMAVVAIAGETETGLVDPVKEIGQITNEHVYYHLDGAYGLPYKLSAASELFCGSELADSVAVDAHKALYTPYSAGFVIFKDVSEHALINLSARDAAYVFKDGEASLGQKRIEGSMGAGPLVSTLSVIQSLGKEGLEALYNYTLKNIDYLHEKLEQSSILYPLHEPDINVLCFSIRPEFLRHRGINTNEQLTQLIEDSRKKLDNNPDGRSFFFSSTALPVDDSIQTFEDNSSVQPVYRAVLMHPYTTSLEIDESIENLEKILQGNIR